MTHFKNFKLLISAAFFICEAALLFGSTSSSDPQMVGTIGKGSINETDSTITIPSMKLHLLTPWFTVNVKFLLVGRSTSPTTQSKILNVAGKMAVYNIPDQTNNTLARLKFTVLVIDDPIRKQTCVIAGNELSVKSDSSLQNFYVSNNSGLKFYGANSGINWQESYLELPSASGSTDKAIARFEAEFDGNKLLQLDRIVAKYNRVNFDVAATPYYFSDSPNPGGMDIFMNIDTVDLTDEVMCIGMTNPNTKKQASFWVDLKASKVIKSKVDGVEMDLTTGRPFAVPQKKP